MRFKWLLYSGRARALAIIAVALGVAAGLQAFDANPAVSQNQSLFAYRSESNPGLDPDSGAWDLPAKIQVPLTAQIGIYAAGGGSIQSLWAQAVHHDGKLYIRMEWEDATQDDNTARPELFADAAALEFPAKSATSVPAICMGQADQAVNIWHWRADSQAGVEDPLDEEFGQGSVDDYPSKETLFYTAREAGNPFANPDAGAVQNLIAEAFGTLSPAGEQGVEGKGVYANGRWAVVFERDLGASADDQAELAAGTQTDMAFAVWNGSEGDRDGMKAISQFVTLQISDVAVPGSEGGDGFYLWLALGLLVGVAAIGAGLAVYGSRKGG